MEQYTVTGMSCAACSARVEKAVSKVPGVTSCSEMCIRDSFNSGAHVFRRGDISFFFEFKVCGPRRIHGYAKPCAGFFYGGELFTEMIDSKLYLGKQDIVNDRTQFCAVFQTFSSIVMLM